MLQAITGWLVVAHAARWLAGLVLGYRDTLGVEKREAGLVFTSRVEMLGRVLRERETVVLRDGLMRATRELRYPRLPVYAGLIALALGSYLGVGMVVDGVRAASASMFGLGALVALVGLGIDFVLSSLLPSSSGACRVVFIVRRGSPLCIGGVDRASADSFLGHLASSALADPAPRPSSSRPRPRVGEAGGGADLASDPAQHQHARNTG